MDSNGIKPIQGHVLRVHRDDIKVDWAEFMAYMGLPEETEEIDLFITGINKK